MIVSAVGVKWLRADAAACILLVTAVSLAAANAAWRADATGPVADDGVPAEERSQTYGDLNGSATSSMHRDIVIVHRSKRYVYFGYYRANQMTEPGWKLFARTLAWATDGKEPADTKIWLATYNGTLDPNGASAEKGPIAFYNYMVNVLGYEKSNITVRNQQSIETGDFAGMDLVFYSWTFNRDATNVIRQGVPFITVAAGETDELGIGIGEITLHEYRDTAYVLNNEHPITMGFDLGEFRLESSMWTDASEASGDGVALISADPAAPCDPCDTNCDGSVDLTDVEPFIDLLLGGKPCDACSGDTNDDGSVDLSDVEAFIECLF